MCISIAGVSLQQQTQINMTKKTTKTAKKVALSDGEEKRGRKPGTPKTGGRKKGTPNKMTSSLRKRLEKQLEPFIDNLETLIMKIADPKDRVQAITSILPYVAPKMATIDMKSEEEHNITIEQTLVDLDKKFSVKKAELEVRKVKLVSFE